MYFTYFVCGLFIFVFRLTSCLYFHIQVFAKTHHRSKLQLSKEFQSSSALVVGNPPAKYYESLLSAVKEAVLIAKLYDVDPVLDSQGTLSYVASKMRTARIIHLATHSVLDLKRSENAYIPGAILLGADGGK